MVVGCLKTTVMVAKIVLPHSIYALLPPSVTKSSPYGTGTFWKYGVGHTWWRILENAQHVLIAAVQLLGQFLWPRSVGLPVE